MPIVKNDCDQVIVEKPIDPVPETKKPFIYDTNVVDTKDTPHDTLLTHISGSSWTVDYFSQVLGGDQVGTAQQTDQPEVYQQYVKIVDFEIKVETPLTHTEDTKTREFTVSGGGNIYPSILPNRGDMFIADTGEGRSAIFTVDAVNRLTILRDTCYGITYHLVEYTTQKYIDDLTSKVVKTVHFHKDRCCVGETAFLTPEASMALLSVKDAFAKLLDLYYHHFFDKEYQTFTYREHLTHNPNKSTQTYYDPFLVQFMDRFLDKDRTEGHPRFRQLNCLGEEGMDVYTLWNVLVACERNLIRAKQTMTVWPSSRFQLWPVFASIAYTRIDGVVYPIYAHNGSEPMHIGLLETQGSYPIPTVHYPVDYDDYYVFSGHFYKQEKEQMSVLENLVTMYLNDRRLDTTILLQMVSDVESWDMRSQYYYIPVMLMLLLTMG